MIRSLVVQAAILSSIGSAQSVPSTLLPPQTALPILFSGTVDANRAKVGDPVFARTIQVIRVPGLVIPPGSLLQAHLVAVAARGHPANGNQQPQESQLGIHFDVLKTWGASLPLDIYVRALADPISSWTATEPYGDTKWDPDAASHQVGGDTLTPFQKDVVDPSGQVVAQNMRGGVFGHLRAAEGNSPSGCDAGSVDQSLALFSASACGLYGFGETTMQHSGRTKTPSTLLLSSSNGPVKLWKGTTALLEVRSPSVP